jgi:nickel/cobalt transporter (NicO) family protein
MRTFFALLVIALFFCQPVQADPFTGRAALEPQAVAPSATLNEAGWFDRVQFQLRDWQIQMHEMMAAEVAALQGKEPTKAFWLLILVSFLYGIFHAAAPGHGKTIVASYFLGRKAHWLHGIGAGLIFAIGHSVSAVAIVAVLAIILKLSNIEVMEQAKWVGVVGYGLIICIGFWLLWKGIRNHAHTCDHDHGKHSHHHHHHGHQNSPLQSKDTWALFTSASMAPCTGTMLVLLFSLAAGALWAGIFAAIAVALGMWLTIAMIGMLTIWFNQRLDSAGPLLRWRNGIRRGLTIFGAILIITTGALLLSATLAAAS